MEKIVTVIEQRPNYYRGQLLLEDDFLAEQKYHTDARERHSLNLHGSGIVQGFTLSRSSANSIAISPGYAIDESGHEIFLDETKHINLAEFGPNELLRASLVFAVTTASEVAGQPQKRRDCMASIIVAKISKESPGLTLATIQLDDEGNLGHNAIDYSQTKYVTVLVPGSIQSALLHESLKTGWLRLPFKAHPLVNPPEGETGIPPAFRVGTTESLSPDPKDADEKDRGAGGAMAIPVPANATRVTRFRIAGSENEGGIFVRLFRCGWDPVKMKHVKEMLVDHSIESSSSGPFLGDFEVTDTALNPEYHTLAVWVRGVRRTAISLIAVEFSYY